MSRVRYKPTSIHHPDSERFLNVLYALKYWRYCEYHSPDPPAIPHPLFASSQFEAVKEYFNKKYADKYRSTASLPRHNFDQAIELLDGMVEAGGVSAVYSFFRALSPEMSEHRKTLSHEERIKLDPDDMVFKSLVSKVIVPHFDPYTLTDGLHGATVAGHGLAALLSGFTHTAVAAVSAGPVAWSLYKKQKNRIQPSLKAIEHVLPVLEDMHHIADHALEVMREITPSRNSEIPPLPPFNKEWVETTLCQTQDKLSSDKYAR